MFDMDPPKYKHRAISQAMDFAASKGKVAETISLDQKTSGLFDLVDKTDPRAKRAGAIPADKMPDHYDELLKLDDLRKKGILTEAEFEAEKKKLLEGGSGK
jgi:hypothetical protein